MTTKINVKLKGNIDVFLAVTQLTKQIQRETSKY